MSFNKPNLFIDNGKHRSFVLNAINCPFAVVDDVILTIPESITHERNINDLLTRINNLIAKAETARTTGQDKIDTALRVCGNLIAYVEYFQVKLSANYKRAYKAMKDGTYISPELTAKMADIEAQAETRREAALAHAIKNEEADLALWIAGADKRRNFTKTALRIKNDHVETTKGARVTLTGARELALLIYAGKDVTGYQIEGYTVNSYVNGVLEIGCHAIDAAEIERVLPLLLK